MHTWVKKDKSTLIKILLGLLGVLLLAYFMFTGEKTKHYAWTENYRVTSDQPYGTQFVQKLIEGYRPWKEFKVNDQKPLQKVLDTSNLKVKTNYILIGNGIYLDEDDRLALKNFIFAGNDAFVFTNDLAIKSIDSTWANECGFPPTSVRKDTLSVVMNFYDHDLSRVGGYQYAFRFGKADVPYFWHSVSVPMCESGSPITRLGYIGSDNVNFFSVAYGDGHLYVHTNPVVFTNYFITKQDKLNYVAAVFSYLQGEAVIWDEFSKSEFIPKNSAVNPMAYILLQDSLRYAWWLLLAAVVLYSFFTAKRKQRVIPVLATKVNTSLEFVNAVAKLYYQNAHHRDIAKKRIKYFFHFIKARYSLSTQILSEPYLIRLAEKSSVTREDLDVVAREFERAEKSRNYDHTTLIDLQNALEGFYKKCK